MIFAAPHGRAASVRPTERLAPDVVEIPQLHRSAPQQVLEQDLHAHQDEDHAADQLGLGLIFCAEGAADLDAEEGEQEGNLKEFPSDFRSLLRSFLALAGYKKIFQSMERNPDLTLTIRKDIRFNKGNYTRGKENWSHALAISARKKKPHSLRKSGGLKKTYTISFTTRCAIRPKERPSRTKMRRPRIS